MFAWQSNATKRFKGDAGRDDSATAKAINPSDPIAFRDRITEVNVGCSANTTEKTHRSWLRFHVGNS
jgi:hypothetical protein